MNAKNQIKPHQSTLIVAAMATLIGFLIPVIQNILLPLQYLNTHLHELSHAIVAKLTGADVERIVVNANGSGETPVYGGSLILIASAGYVGASCFGALMIYVSRTEKGARTILGALAALLTFSMVVWVRGDRVGEVSGFGWIAVLAICALFVKGRTVMFVGQFLGLQQCLNAVRSVFTLVQLSAATDVHSDASIMKGATGVPTIIWAFIWALFSLGLVLWTLQKSWDRAIVRA